MKKLTSFFSILLCFAMVVTAFPAIEVDAASKAGVRYVYGDAEHPKIRTGIESVDLDDVVYYDMDQGKKNDSGPKDSNNLEFYKCALTGEASEYSKNKNYSGKSNLLNQWAEVAEKILYNNSDWCTSVNRDAFINKGTDSDDGVDLSEGFSTLSEKTKGSKKEDRMTISGLKYTDSLMKARKDVSKTLWTSIDRYSLDKKYNQNDLKNDIFFDYSGKEKCLAALYDEKKQDVYYSIVTYVNREGRSMKYDYNAFVIAFYDFQLHPITADGLEYITAAEGYSSIAEAAKQGVDGVTYTAIGEGTGYVDYSENDTKIDNTISSSTSTRKSESVGNTTSASKTHTFSKSFGHSIAFEVVFPGTKHLLKDSGVKMTNTFTHTYSISDALTTGWSSTKTLSNETSNTVSTSMTLPAQTAIEIQNFNGGYDASFEYNCPVAVTCKVAICGMAGECYADSAACCYFGTAGYDHRSFSTVFGCGDEKNVSVGGGTARQNLYNRAIANIDLNGFETTYGNTVGWKDCGDVRSTNDAGLKNFIGKTVIKTKKLKPVVEYREVDKNGKITGRLLKSYIYGQKLSYDNEYRIAPASTKIEYNIETSPEVSVTKKAHLYKGKVIDKNNNEVDNSFVSGNEKVLKLQEYKDRTFGQNTYVFYYVNDDDYTTEPYDYTDSSIQMYEDYSTTSGSNTEIQNIVSWLSTHEVMSEAGSNMHTKITGSGNTTGQIVPLYKLSAVLISNARKSGSISLDERGIGTSIKEYIDSVDVEEGIGLSAGEKFFVYNLNLFGINENAVKYFGFDDTLGEWKRVCYDESTKSWKEDKNTYNDNIVKYKTNSSGSKYIEAGNITDPSIDPTKVTLKKNKDGEYEAYYQFFFNENLYTSKEQGSGKYSTNEDVQREVVKIKIGIKKFKGTLSIEPYDQLDICASDNNINLNKLISVKAFDESGEEQIAPVSWSSKQSDGIDIKPDGTVYFSKAGNYDIRVSSGDIKSDYIAIKVKEKRVAVPSFETLDLKTKDTKITNENPTVEIYLGDYLQIKDQYGNAWTGETPAIKYDLDDTYEGASIAADTGVLTVTEPGTYKVYAAIGNKKTSTTVSISDERSFSVNLDNTYLEGATASLNNDSVEWGGNTCLTIKSKKGQSFENEEPYAIIYDGTNAKAVEAKKQDDGSFVCNISKIKSDITVYPLGYTEEKVGKITISGTRAYLLGDGAVDLNDSLDALIENESGVEIDKDFYWEKKESDGITLEDSRWATFTAEGVYHVRAVCGNVTSDWYKIVAVEPNVIDSVEFKTPEFKTSELTLQSVDDPLKFNLKNYVSFYDVFGIECTADWDNLSFELDDNYSGAKINSDGTLEINEAGNYKIFARYKDFEITPINIPIKYSDGTEVSKINVPESVSIRFEEQPVDLNELINVSYENSYGKELSRTCTWEAKELGVSIEGATANFGGEGEYHVLARCGGKLSDWITVKVLEPIKLDKITFTAPELTGGNILTDEKSEIVVPNLKSCLKYYNQYEEEWTGAVPDVTFSVEGTAGGASIEDDTLTMTKAGEYTVTAHAEGFEIKPIKLTVIDKTSVDLSVDNKISGSNYVLMITNQNLVKGDDFGVVIKPNTKKEIIEKPVVKITEGSGVVGEPTKNSDGSWSVAIEKVNSDTKTVMLSLEGSTEDVAEKATLSGTGTIVVGDKLDNLNDLLDVDIRDGNGNKISKRYTWVSVDGGLSIEPNGIVSASEPGIYDVKIVTGDTKTESNEASIIAISIKPPAVKIKSVKKAKAAFTARWKAQKSYYMGSRINGYAVRYSKNGNMSDSRVAYKNGYKKTSLKVKGLERKQKYYVQVASYVTYNGRIYYSNWSKTKSVKTK